MKKLLVAVVVAFLLFVAAREVYRARVSDETRVRWLLADTATAFNAGRVGGVLDSFATDYKETTASVDRELLRGALQYLFFRAAQDRTSFRVALPDESLTIEQHEDEPAATVKFSAILHEQRGDQERRVWEVAIDAELRKTDDGWRFVSSRHKTITGQPPR